MVIPKWQKKLITFYYYLNEQKHPIAYINNGKHLTSLFLKLIFSCLRLFKFKQGKALRDVNVGI